MIVKSHNSLIHRLNEMQMQFTLTEQLPWQQLYTPLEDPDEGFGATSSNISLRIGIATQPSRVYLILNTCRDSLLDSTRVHR